MNPENEPDRGTAVETLTLDPAAVKEARGEKSRLRQPGEKERGKERQRDRDRERREEGDRDLDLVVQTARWSGGAGPPYELLHAYPGNVLTRKRIAVAKATDQPTDRLST